MTDAEDDVAAILSRWDATGTDTAALRAQWAELTAVEVGEDTPAPRSRLPVTLPDPTGLILPPLHNGINEPPEGKFYLPPFNTPTYVGQRQYKRLSTKVRRVITAVTLLWMLCLTFAFVVIYRW